MIIFLAFAFFCVSAPARARETFSPVTDIGPERFSVSAPGLKHMTGITSNASIMMVYKETAPCLLLHKRETMCKDYIEDIYPGLDTFGLCEDNFNSSVCTSPLEDYGNACDQPSPTVNCRQVICAVENGCYLLFHNRLGQECAPGGFYCNEDSQCLDARSDDCLTTVTIDIFNISLHPHGHFPIHDDSGRLLTTLLVLRSGRPYIPNATVVLSPATVPEYILADSSADPDLFLFVDTGAIRNVSAPGDLFPVYIDYYHRLNLSDIVYSSLAGYAIYAPVPAIYTLCPGTALAYVYNEILVNGAGFYNSSVLSCYFNNASVPVRFIDPARVVCIVTPADPAAGVVSIAVSNDGVQLSANVSLRVLGACDTIKPGSVVVDSACVCPAGSYDTGAFCQLCADGFYQSAAGQSMCIPCGPSRTTLRAVGSLSEDACVCADGFYSPDPVGQPQKCVACAAGMVCVNGSVAVAAGYWRGAAESTEMLPCPMTLDGQRCKGGAGAGDDVCATGYEGPLCSVCSTGYGNVGPSQCRPCNGRGADASVVALLFVLGCLGVGVLVRVSAEPEKGANGGTIGSVLKIMLNYVQIVFYIGTLSARWSPETISFFNIFLPMSISPTFVSVKCVSELSFEARIGLVIAAPVLLALLVMAFMVLAHVLVPERVLRWLFPVNMNTYAMTMLIVLYTVHPMLASSTLSALDCTRVPGAGGGLYVSSDMSVDCASASYARVRLAAALFIVLYIFGAPAYVMRRMWVNYAAIMQAQNCTVNFESEPACRYLYPVRGYKADTFLWEAVVLFRKLAIVAAAALVSEGLQLAWCGAVLVLSLCLTVQRMPFVKVLENRLEIIAHVALGISILLAFHSYFLRGESGAAAILVVLIVTNAGAFALMAGSVIVRFRKTLYEFIDGAMQFLQFGNRSARRGGNGEIRMYDRGGTVAEMDGKYEGDGWGDFEVKF